MFERFTAAAREVVVAAQEEARALHHDHLGTEHLLLGLLRSPTDTVAAQVLGEQEITANAARRRILQIVGPCEELDAAALASIGIDLDAVRRSVEETFGPGALDRTAKPCRDGHIPLTPRSKKVLELSLREAQHLKHDYLGAEHLLLGLLQEGKGLAVEVLTDLGADLPRMRAAVMTRIQRSA